MNLLVSRRGSSFLDVECEEVHSANRYLFYLNDEIKVDGSGRAASFTDLLANSPYRIRVVAKNGEDVVDEGTLRPWTPPPDFPASLLPTTKVFFGGGVVSWQLSADDLPNCDHKELISVRFEAVSNGVTPGLLRLQLGGGNFRFRAPLSVVAYRFSLEADQDGVAVQGEAISPRQIVGLTKGRMLIIPRHRTGWIR
jgi:hypothetical protein